MNRLALNETLPVVHELIPASDAPPPGTPKRPSGLEDSLEGCSLDTDVALRLYSGAIPEEIVGSPGSPVPEDIPSIARLSRASSSALGRSPVGILPSEGASGAATPVFKRLSSLRMDSNVAEAWSAASAYVRSSWQYKKTRRAAAAAVLSEFEVENIVSGGPKGIQGHAKELISRDKIDDTFYIYDLGNVFRMFKAWKGAMPRVTPFYAVKCNPEPAIVKLLLALGSGFDCASKAELSTILALGVPTSRIIFAHPCKRPLDIQFAAEHRVEYTTFDTESELDKIAKFNPKFRCVLRIRADDPDARVHLGLKYGAEPKDAPALLEYARSLSLQVCGVSFHVGSGAKNLSTFTGAIHAARHIFDLAELMGFNMDLLDIGGGFTGHFDEHGAVMFGEIARTINSALEEEFPEDMGVRVIAEPGRYFAECSASLFTPVYGQRDRNTPEGTFMNKDYWITDGLYGSFNCMLYDDQRPEQTVVRSPLLPEVTPEMNEEVKSTVWGPTCDSADCVYKDIMLPRMRNGDFLMFTNAGAYTVAGACDFNGINMTQPAKFYVFSDRAVDVEDDDGDAAAGGYDTDASSVRLGAASEAGDE